MSLNLSDRLDRIQSVQRQMQETLNDVVRDIRELFEITNHSATKDADLVLIGLWGQNSALLHRDCLLSKFKMLFLDKLTAFGIPFPNDKQNMTPHINVHGDLELIERLNASRWRLVRDSVQIQDNVVSVTCPENTHMTLVFSRGIGKMKEQVTMCVDACFAELVR